MRSRVARPRRWRAWRAAIMPWVRLSAYCGVVAFVVAGFALRSAFADMRRSALALGREVASFGTLPENVHRIRMNGEAAMLTSAMVDVAADTLLDSFEQQCREHSAGVPDTLARLPAAIRRGFDGEGRRLAETGTYRIRAEGEGEGVVVCITRDTPGTEGFLAGALAFAKSKNLGDLGNVRYMFARRHPTIPNRTHVVLAWTDGSFRVDSLMPPAGEDAPGEDSPDAPRPRDSRRLLSTYVEGAPYGVRIYTTARGIDEVLATYKVDMPKLGWAAVPVQEGPAKGVTFTRPNSDVMISATSDAGGTVVSILEFRETRAGAREATNAAGGAKSEPPTSMSATPATSALPFTLAPASPATPAATP